MNIWLAAFLTVALLGFNAFFVAAEFAVTSSRRSSVEPLAREGERGARQALYALEHVSLMLAVSQLGITVMSTSLGVIAEPAIARLVAPPLLALGMSSAAVHLIAFLVALSIVLFLHVVFGEMVPKNISIARATSSLLALAPALTFLARLLRPIVSFLDRLANWFISLAGFEPATEISAAFTADEVAAILEESQQKGTVADEDGLVAGTLLFDQIPVSDLLVKEKDVRTLTGPITPERVEAAVAQTGYSRFPVADGAGNWLGYVHLKDALYAAGPARGVPLESWRVRELPVISPDQPADEALQKMQKAGSHVAAVRSEGGPILGALFLEDLLEELVGQVHDASQKQA